MTTVSASTPIELVEGVYATLPERAGIGRERLGRPLTLTEKVLINHLLDPQGQELVRGESYADFNPDRVAMQDATAQMALLQFMTAGLPEVAAPSTVHCDHLIQAKVGASIDLGVAIDTNQEVYDFLRSVSAKYSIGFWGPGSGIIHQVVLENYAFPGGMMIGTDSHTPNAGGLGMVAIGVGGADAVDVMTGFPFNVRWPKVIGVKLTGSLSSWSSPKDVILEVARVLTVEGGTGAIIEYHGPGADSISATGKGTICNMGAEIGATTSLFPYDANMAAYLKATGREAIADAADKVADELRPDDGAFYDQLIEIDLDELKPLINGPHSPDRAHRIGAEVGRAAEENGWPLEISSALIGSCTNSSYEDITPGRVDRPPGVGEGPDVEGRAADHAGLRADPGDDRARRPARRPRGRRRHRARQRVRSVHRPVVAARQHHRPAEHDRQLVQPQLPEAQRRLGQHAELRDVAGHGDGARPVRAARLRPDRSTRSPRPTAPRSRSRRRSARCSPTAATTPARTRSPPRPPTARASTVEVSPTSDRLQLLEPFPAWDGKDYLGPAGADEGPGQVHDRPHLGGRPVAEVPRPPREHLRQPVPRRRQRLHRRHRRGQGPARRQRPGRSPTSPSTTARQGVRWCAIGDRNYGEGSSREHAAMEPRFRGGLVIFARSFARIHETNAKKQGLVPLTFADPATYDEIERGRPHQRARPPAGAGPERALPDRQARRHDGRLRVHATRSAPSRSSGSRPAAPSTSCARRSPPAS